MRVLLLAAVVVLAFPSAGATWYVAGTFEPDTAYDSGEWMFPDPPAPGTSRLYLNGITMTKGTIGLTPNVGLLETRNEAPVVESYYVMLGVWSDCNGDGYIGMAEHAVREYPAELMPDPDACPDVTGPANEWAPGAHTYNGWVSEFLFLGRQGTQRIYADPDILVWGDYERPDHAPTLGQCPTTPLPRGTLQSTGGLVNYVHCRLEQKEIAGLASFNELVGMIGDPLGLAFEDEHDATSGTAGQVATFGSEDQANSPVYVWDCDAAPTPVGPASVSSPDPRVNDDADPTTWTIPALYNATYDGIRPLDNCDPSDDRAGGFYLNEDDYNRVDPNNKTEADWNFNFVAGFRGGAPLGQLSPGTAGAPFDGGLVWSTYQHSGWHPDNSYGSKLGPNMVRASLDGVDIASAYYVTFYAHLGAATIAKGFDRPENGGGTYGSWHCGDHEDGIHHGWNCDADLWYRNPDGSPYPPERPFVRPGQAYELRDVDCYDGNTALGIAVGLPAYGSDPCV